MTRDTAEKVALGVLTAVLTAIVVPVVLNAMSPRVTRAEFTAHLRESLAVHDSVRANIERLESTAERVLDVICDDRAAARRPEHRSCKSATINRP